MRSAYAVKRLGRQELELSEHVRDERFKMLHAVAQRLNDENRNRKRDQILLELKPAIHRQEHVELAARECEQLAVLDPSPPSTLNGDRVVTQQEGAEASRKVLVKQDAHRA